MDLTLVILAAGLASRYGSLKQIDPVGQNDEILLDYSIYDAIQAGFSKTILVVNPQSQQLLQAHLNSLFGSKIQISYAIQDPNDLPLDLDISFRQKPWGTGHALYTARNYIDSPFVVINADDFYGRSSFETISDYFQQSLPRDFCALVTYKLKNTLSDFGQVSRGVCIVDNDKLIDILEHHHVKKIDDLTVSATLNDLPITLDPDTPVSMSFYALSPNIFSYADQIFTEFLQNLNGDPKKEFYLPTLITSYTKLTNTDIQTFLSHNQWFGMTYKEDKLSTQAHIQNLISQGIYPERL